MVHEYFSENVIVNKNNEILIYQTEDGQTQVDVRMENDTMYQ